MLLARSELVIVLASLATAAPFGHPWFGLGGNHEGGIGYGKRFPGPDTNAPICNLAAAVMPTGKFSIVQLMTTTTPTDTIAQHPRPSRAQRPA